MEFKQQGTIKRYSTPNEGLPVKSIVKNKLPEFEKGQKKETDDDYNLKDIVVDVYREIKNEHNTKFIEEKAKEHPEVQRYVETILNYFNIDKLADIPEDQKFFILCDLQSKAAMHEFDEDKKKKIYREK